MYSERRARGKTAAREEKRQDGFEKKKKKTIKKENKGSKIKYGKPMKYNIGIKEQTESCGSD